VPVVVAEEQVIWLAGWRIDDRFKVGEGTARVLRLSFERRADTG
jgi:hypothetical protein